MRPEAQERAFIISRMITKYPVLADQVRRAMRRILAEEGHITSAAILEEARLKAIEDQKKEGLTAPLAQEPAERWEFRVIEHYRQLTDYYFACYHPVEDAVAIMDEIKFQHMDLHNVLEDGETTVEMMGQAERFRAGTVGEEDEAAEELLRVNLIKNLFSDQLEFIGVAKRIFTLHDLQEIKARIIGTGKVGGKAAGMLLGHAMLLREREQNPDTPEIRIPACYFLGSDVFYQFFEENEVDFYRVQKYKSMEQVRREYPNICETIQQYGFPGTVVIKLRNLLNKFQDTPLIVRSSSLLEDNVRTSFAGKYESVFVANSGTPEENLEELLTAIRTVYASVFSPDVIAYRKEKNLLDYDERMAILIQNVVGRKRGSMFSPYLAGVGFSLNMFRWSERLNHEDGMLRLVMGLGTRAVGRVGNDYPRMVPLTDPSLRPEKDPREILKYSQKQIDLLNLETRQLETISVQNAETVFHRNEITPAMSLFKDGYILDSWFDKGETDRLVVTMNEVLREAFPKKYKQLLDILHRGWGMHVDTEFAVDFNPETRHMTIYLLQCRPLAMNRQMAPVEIPESPDESAVFFQSSGITPCGVARDIRYIVSVNPDSYHALENEHERRQVGQLVGRLNRVLPAKGFILIGPGRWGTVDVKLGVHVGYSDISNAAVLIELGEGEQGFTSEVSYGTHFYLDLIEAQIYPLSILMDREGTTFNKDFVENARNCLGDLLPDDKGKEHLVKVVDVPAEADGEFLSVYMSIRKGRSLAVFEKP